MTQIVCIRKDYIFNPLIWTYIMRKMEILNPKFKNFLIIQGKNFPKKKDAQEQQLL